MFCKNALKQHGCACILGILRLRTRSCVTRAALRMTFAKKLYGHNCVEPVQMQCFEPASNCCQRQAAIAFACEFCQGVDYCR